jgi:hypothetical protein
MMDSLFWYGGWQNDRRGVLLTPSRRRKYANHPNRSIKKIQGRALPDFETNRPYKKNQFTFRDGNLYRVRYVFTSGASFNHYRDLIPRHSGRNTGGAGDLFPRICKDFKEKSSIPRHSGRGFFIFLPDCDILNSTTFSVFGSRACHLASIIFSQYSG